MNSDRLCLKISYPRTKDWPIPIFSQAKAGMIRNTIILTPLINTSIENEKKEPSLSPAKVLAIFSAFSSSELLFLFFVKIFKTTKTNHTIAHMNDKNIIGARLYENVIPTALNK